MREAFRVIEETKENVYHGQGGTGKTTFPEVPVEHTVSAVPSCTYRDRGGKRRGSDDAQHVCLPFHPY